MSTTKNTKLLAINTANKNFQLTVEKSSFAMDRKMRAGKEKVPTNVFNPFDSDFVITSSLPAMYLKEYARLEKSVDSAWKEKCTATHPHIIIPKHCTRARYKLSVGVASLLSVTSIFLFQMMIEIAAAVGFSAILLVASAKHHSQSVENNICTRCIRGKLILFD